MLSRLSIRDIVLIEKLDIDFLPGLSVLTGETGAGKSILLDALSLALGARGDASLVRHGVAQGQVIAVFDVPRNHPARALLAENAIEDDGDIILRRVQTADGRTRVFVNDQPSSVTLMRDIGQALVEIHGQHDERALVDPGAHRDLLDSFGGHLGAARATGEAWRYWRGCEQDFAKHRAKVEAAAREADYLRASVAELAKLDPQPGEETQLAELRATMMRAEKIASEIHDAQDVLSGPSSPLPQLASLLRRLQRKHSVAVDDLAQLRDTMAADLADLDAGEERLHGLEKQAAAAREAYDISATQLSSLRHAAAIGLTRAVMAELPALKLERAEFIVSMTSDAESRMEEGIDQVEFWVRTNPGTRPGPMMKVASGGELSRFLLALKVALADRGSAPTLVFDEIDTGVGGAVADAIGQRLARLSMRVQVLSVTHAPQVAARAATHFLISKSGGTDKVATGIAEMDRAARQEEIARMLAGATITDEARAAAERLLRENTAAA